MNISAIESTGVQMQRTSASEVGAARAAKTASQGDKDLPKTQQVDATQPTDRVELSSASRVLAALSEQSDEGAELQLPPDKLRELAHG